MRPFFKMKLLIPFIFNLKMNIIMNWIPGNIRTLIKAYLPVYLNKWLMLFQTSPVIEHHFDLAIIRIEYKGKEYHIPLEIDELNNWAFEHEGKKYKLPPMIRPPITSEEIKYQKLE